MQHAACGRNRRFRRAQLKRAFSETYAISIVQLDVKGPGDHDLVSSDKVREIQARASTLATATIEPGKTQSLIVQQVRFAANFRCIGISLPLGDDQDTTAVFVELREHL